MSGVCYLVGAGPGDPGLITAKGLECVRRADSVHYDRLVAPEILLEAPPHARLVCVGKHAGGGTSQTGIEAELVRAVRAGEVVVRLKGGDPFVFGRGGEEALALAEAGLAFEIVPGVTSGIAATAYAGIPVTHRGVSSSVTLVSAHPRAAGRDDVDWEACARIGGTLCVYMGLGRLEEVCRRLTDAGMPASTPSAAVSWGTRREQVRILGTLDDLPRRVLDAGLASPVMIVVGEAVALAGSLQWFGADLPMGDSRRPTDQGARTVAAATSDGGKEART